MRQWVVGLAINFALGCANDAPYARLRGRDGAPIRRVEMRRQRRISPHPSAVDAAGGKGGQGWMPVYFSRPFLAPATARAVCRAESAPKRFQKFHGE